MRINNHILVSNIKFHSQISWSYWRIKLEYVKVSVWKFEGSVQALSPVMLPLTSQAPKQNPDFISTFSVYVTSLLTMSPNIILLGYFNVHMDNDTDPLTKDFTSCWILSAALE